ncbi:MAG: hypothetical protein GTN46_10660 [Gammaproteobacteria bacterium]|nr:hypothetical protein [Gammaproteobacteria bacterium]NIT06440.1 hypothetical protein [Gammaproteobacteria bacterium]NIT41919.1 hypothetical protein [Gammaproteobacteria bacterium]
MFEIIMLLAFLYAATCQFFPERSNGGQSTTLHGKLAQEKRKSTSRRERINKESKRPVKSESRSNNYAQAA